MTLNDCLSTDPTVLSHSKVLDFHLQNVNIFQTLCTSQASLLSEAEFHPQRSDQEAQDQYEKQETKHAPLSTATSDLMMMTMTWQHLPPHCRH